LFWLLGNKKGFLRLNLVLETSPQQDKKGKLHIREQQMQMGRFIFLADAHLTDTNPLAVQVYNQSVFDVAFDIMFFPSLALALLHSAVTPDTSQSRPGHSCSHTRHAQFRASVVHSLTRHIICCTYIVHIKLCGQGV
jgi:hypothetical protein